MQLVKVEVNFRLSLPNTMTDHFEKVFVFGLCKPNQTAHQPDYLEGISWVDSCSIS